MGAGPGGRGGSSRRAAPEAQPGQRSERAEASCRSRRHRHRRHQHVHSHAGECLLAPAPRRPGPPACASAAPPIGHTSLFKCSGRSRSFFACLLNSSPSTSSFCDPPENPIRKGFYVVVKPQSIGAVRPPVVTSPTRPCIDGETETQGRAESPSLPRERVASWNWDV